MMMLTAGPFGTTCSDMFQIMFEIALKMDVTIGTDRLTDELIGFLELLFATKNFEKISCLFFYIPKSNFYLNFLLRRFLKYFSHYYN